MVCAGTQSRICYTCILKICMLPCGYTDLSIERERHTEREGERERMYILLSQE